MFFWGVAVLGFVFVGVLGFGVFVQLFLSSGPQEVSGEKTEHLKPRSRRTGMSQHLPKNLPNIKTFAL